MNESIFTKNHGKAVISVLVISCDLFVARGIFSYLENAPDIIVIDQLHSTSPLVHTILRERPNIVLIHTQKIDSHMAEICQQVELQRLPTKCVFLLSSDDQKQYAFAVKIGATGVLCYNDVTSEELIKVLHHIHAGEPFIAPTIAYRIVRAFYRNGVEIEPLESENTLATLTEREMNVLSLLAKGWSNRDIADKLSIEVKTVKNHLTNIYSKMNVRSRSEAIAIYYTYNTSEKREVS